jgi:predicted MFS family arabinose efflux permease
VVIELRSTSPLVDVRAVRHPAVAGGNLARFVGGIGMYLLLTLVTRYAQTPHGSGFGLTTFVVELVLIPFSVIGFVAGKLTPRVRRADRSPRSWPAAPSWSAAGSPCSWQSGRTRPNCSWSMGVLGFSVGGLSGPMPGLILAATPKAETSSDMSVNYVVRSAGYSLGSAIGGGPSLAAGTGPATLSPTTAPTPPRR